MDLKAFRDYDETSLAETGYTEAVVCVATAERDGSVCAIACRKPFPTGREAIDWAQYQSKKLLRRKDVVAAGVVYLEAAVDDDAILTYFEDNLDRSQE